MKRIARVLVAGFLLGSFGAAVGQEYFLRAPRGGAERSAPARVSIPPTGDLEPSATAISEAVTPSGFSISVPVTAENGAAVSVEGGPFAASAELAPGESFRVRAVAPDAFASSAAVPVVVGGIRASWQISTLGRDVIPDAFFLDGLVGLEPSTVYQSPAVAASGYDGELPLSVTGGIDAALSVDGGQNWVTAVDLASGQSFVVRQSTSPDWSTPSGVTVTLGPLSQDWEVTTRDADTVPDAFAIAEAVDVEPATATVSEPVVVDGFDGELPISATNGALVSVEGGAYAASGTIAAGDSFAVRLTSGTYDATVATTVSVGSRDAEFRVTTRSIDASPDAFAVAAVTGVEPGTLTASGPVRVDGFDETLTISATNGAMVSVDGGAYAASTTIASGRSFRVRLMSGPFGQTVSSTVSLGDQTAAFNVTTRAADVIPNDFVIAARTGAEPNTATTSAPVKIIGIEAPVSISADNGAMVSVNGGAFAASATISNDQSFVVRLTSATYGQTVSTTVSAGGKSAEFRVTTRARDTSADEFTIAAATGVEPNALTESDDVRVDGFDETLTISANNGGQVSVEGGAYANSAQIAAGQSFTVRLTSAAFGQTATSTVSLGGQTAAFSVVTRAANVSPDDFVIAARTGVEPTTATVSAPVTISGIEASVAISASNGAMISVEGGAYAASGTIGNDQEFTVRLTSGSFGQTASTTVTVGDRTAVFNVTTRAADVVPNDFVIAARTGVEPATATVSMPVTISGIEAPVAISATNGAMVSVEGGAYAAAGSISNGQEFTVRLTSSAAYATTASTTVTVGGRTAAFSVTTRAADVVPDDFVIAARTGVEPATATVSTPVTLSGVEAPVAISATNGAMISVEGGTYAASGTITNGQEFAVRLTSGAFGQTVSTTVSVGGKSAAFSVTTRPANVVPDDFVIAARSGVEPAVATVSAAVTISGIEAPVAISATNGAMVSVEGGTYAASGTIADGQEFTVRLTSGAFGQTVSTTVNVGGKSAAFAVTTRAADVVPNDFVIAARTGVEPAAATASAPVTISGIEAPVSISATNGAMVSVQGGAYAASGTISNGQSFVVRLTSGSFGQSVSTTVTAGTKTASFSVTTRAANVVPDDFVIAARTGVEQNAVTTSSAVTISGIEAPVAISANNGAMVSVQGGAFAASGSISNGQSFIVRLTSAAFGQTRTSTVTVGNKTAVFSVTTREAIGTPDDFTIAARTGVEPTTATVSVPVTITGIERSVTISATNGALVSVEGGTFAASGSISSGQEFTVRLTSAAYGQTISSTITVGDKTAVFVVTTRAADVVPDDFVIAARTGANPSTATISDAVTISGIEAPVAISASNGAMVSVQGGAYAASGTISNGQSFTARLTSGAYGQTVTAIVNVGGKTASFGVTTRAADATPDDFVIAARTGVEPATATVSMPVTISGIEMPVAISASNGAMVSVEGGTFAASGSIADGQEFVVRLTSGAFGQTVSTTVNVGGKSASFNVTTRAADVVPNDFTIAARTGVNPSTATISDAVTISGIEAPVAISATNGAMVSVNNGTYAASGTISNGQSFTVRLTSSAAFGQTASTTVTAGTKTAVFAVTTRAADVVPDDFVIAARTGVEPNTATASAPVVISGIEAPVAISATNGAMVSVQGGAFAASGSISNGQAFLVRLTSAALGQTASTTVNVGGKTAVFAVTTRAAVVIPNDFLIAARTGVEPSTAAISSPVTITGIEVPVSISATNGAMVSVEGGPYAASGSISSGQEFTVRLTSSASFGQTLSTTVSVGGSTAVFAVTTRAADVVPDDFVIAARTGVEPGAATASVPVTITGVEAPVSISATNGAMVSVEGGAYAASGSISNDQEFTVRLTSASYGQSTSTTVSVGGKTAVFAVTTRAADVVPDDFVIAARTGVNPSTVTVSAPVTISGIEAPVAISAGNGAMISVEGGAYAASGTIGNDQEFTVRLTSASYGQTATATVSVGGKSAAFAVTTRAADVVPDDFVIAARTGVEPATATASAPVVISGIEAPVTISANNGGLVSVQGGAFAASGTISNGQSFVVRLVSGSYDVTVSTTVTVGGKTSPFEVTTRSIDDVPDAFVIAARTGVNPASVVQSSAVTVSGFEGQLTLSVSGGVGAGLSVDDGATWVTSASVSAGVDFLVRQTSSAQGLTPSTVTVSLGGVSAGWTVTTRDLDATPDDFVIAARTGAEPTTATASAPVAIAGIERAVAISATNGAMVSVQGGVFAASGSISNGQSFTVRLTSASYGQTVSTTVTVGDKSAVFSVTTRAMDTSVDAFTIAQAFNVDPGIPVTSGETVVSGFEGTHTVSASNGAMVSINGEAFAATGTISAGDSFAVRLTSAAFGQTVSTTVTVGDRTAAFSVTTRAADTVPNAFTIVAITGVNPSTATVSAEVTISGIEAPVTISANNGAMVSVEGGAYAASGTISNGQSFTVRMTSGTFGQTVSTTVNVGVMTAAFSVTTRAADVLPNAFSIPARSGVNPGAATISAEVTISGIEAPVTISANNGGLVSVEGGAYAASVTISNGQSFTVRLTSGTYSQTVSTTVNAGGRTAVFSVTTRAADVVPNAFSIPAQSGVNPGAAAVSAAVGIWGIEAPVSISANNGGLVSVAGGPWVASGTISNGQSFTVRMVSGSFSQTVATAVHVGGVGAVFNVTTRAANTYPNAFSIPARTNVMQSIWVASAAVTITGIEAPVGISASGAAGQISVAGGGFATSATISPGQSFVVRLLSSPILGQTFTTTVNAGGRTAVYSVTTRGR